ncbi:alpha/beta hydrolase [Falsiroseomonas sp. HW251]|uniref:alpha/beta hydrolase n=1 Tax=Falsiroseomonas sp. HW251 TaxID=3390998 RepID=UPI003D31B993
MPARQVFFATNRAVDGQTRRFGGLCCQPPDALRTGFVSCTGLADPVPEGECDFATLQLAPDTADALADSVAKWLLTAEHEGAVPLLFTHGFNHTYADAMSRTAKLCAWLEAGWDRSFLPFAFTWPSQGRGPVSYDDDAQQVGQSGPALAKLIAAVAAARRPGQKVVYLAHSMGVQATRWGMKAIEPMLPALKARPVFAQAFLMAGDDVRDVLDRPGASPTAGALRAIAEVAAFTTIGVNRDDGVVWLVSGVANGKDRLGAAGPSRPQDLPANVAVVDYSRVVLDFGPDILVPQTEVTANWVGHQYYRNAPLVRADLLATIAADGPPAAVPGRRPARPAGSGVDEIPGRLYVGP